MLKPCWLGLYIRLAPIQYKDILERHNVMAPNHDYLALEYQVEILAPSTFYIEFIMAKLVIHAVKTITNNETEVNIALHLGNRDAQPIYCFVLSIEEAKDLMDILKKSIISEGIKG